MNLRDFIMPGLATISLGACGDSRISAKPVVDETTNGFQARILLPDGSPAALARVEIASSWRLAGDTGGIAISLSSDANGLVAVPPLPAGEYGLEATVADDGIRLQFASHPETPRPDTSWRLLPVGSLAGSAAPFARIRAYGSDRSWIADGQGRFLLDGLPAGKWNLRSDSPSTDSLLAEATATVSPSRTDSLTFSVNTQPDLSTWKSLWTHVVAPDPSASADSLADFDMPVRIDARAFQAGLRSPDGLRILTSSLRSVPFAIESWDSAQAVVWAHLPVAHPRRGDTLYLAWGKTGTAKQTAPATPDSVYGIWHLGGSSPLAQTAGSGPAISGDSLTRDTIGIVGHARSMNRLSSMRIAPPSQAAMEASFTISCWIDLEGAQHNHAKIFDLGGTGAPFGSVLMDIDSATGRPALQMAFADSSWRRVVARRNPSGWTHLAATWNGNLRTARFHMDGELQDSLSADAPLLPYTGHDLVVGNQEGGGDGITGRIDEFRLELALRTDAWIRHHWFSQRPEHSSLSPLR